MGKKAQAPTTTTTADPATMAWQGRIYDEANNYMNRGAAGVQAPTFDAMRNFGQFGQTGNLGLAAMSGDSAALNQFMNPYQQNVLDVVQREGARSHALGQNAVNDAATGAGAFGGSRHGVAAGVAAAENARNMNNQIAQLQHEGMNSAMGRATQAANLGFGASSQLHGIGDYMRNVQDQQMGHRFNVAQSALTPLGQTSTQSVQQNKMGSALGGAAMLGAIPGLGWGGALAGGLMGLF